MYFISLKELRDNFQLDISEFKGDDGTAYNIDESCIYFDVDSVMKLEYNEDFKPILPSFVQCSKIPSPEESEQK